MSCLRVPGEKTTQDVTVTSWMTCAQQSFHGSIQMAIKDEVSTSVTSARSDYVRCRDPHRALCSHTNNTSVQPTTTASLPCDDMWAPADIRIRS